MITSKKFSLIKTIFFFVEEKKLKDFYKFFYQIFKFKFWIKGTNKLDLIIFDDVLPSPFSPWRGHEFKCLLENFPNSIVIADQRQKNFSGKVSFRKRKFNLGIKYQILSKKLSKHSVFLNINSKIFYTLFFGSISYYFEKLEKYKINFVFTLYPGGEWEFYNSHKDKRLIQIVCSRYCKGVLVNQKCTYDYLIDNLALNNHNIKLIHGVTLDFSEFSQIREYQEFEIIKIVFIGHKYTNNGEDKGLPIFLEVAQQFANKNVEFYIIGNFDIKNFNVSENILNIKFLGLLAESNLNDFLSKTHIVLSPNSPFKLHKGAYDGFPLGAVGTAGVLGNLILTTDFFNESKFIGFIPNEHFVLIQDNEVDVLDKLTYYIYSFEERKKIALSGQKFLKDYYSFENQITPRIDFFNLILNGNP